MKIPPLMEWKSFTCDRNPFIFNISKRKKKKYKQNVKHSRERKYIYILCIIYLFYVCCPSVNHETTTTKSTSFSKNKQNLKKKVPLGVF